VTTAERDEREEELNEQAALDLALMAYTCSCGAHWPQAYDIVQGDSGSATHYATRRVRCNFCGATGKVCPKRLPASFRIVPNAV
jgi:hypothetical protein